MITLSMIILIHPEPIAERSFTNAQSSHRRPARIHCRNCLARPLTGASIFRTCSDQKMAWGGVFFVRPWHSWRTSWGIKKTKNRLKSISMNFKTPHEVFILRLQDADDDRSADGYHGASSAQAIKVNEGFISWALEKH